jgi:serine/threonine protein kinase
MGNDVEFEDALQPGAVIANFEIVRAIGEGGFGLVYEALNTRIGRRAAIKEYFPKGFAHRDNDGVTVVPEPKGLDKFNWAKDKFVTEAKAVAALNPGGQYRSIVNVFDYHELNGTAYILMEFEEGESLEKYVERSGGTLNQPSIERLLRPLLDGLEWIHSKDILHRDIKPGNIIIRKDGTPVLVDFGAVKIDYSDGKESEMSQKSQFYAGPEQDSNSRMELGPWTDIYALGGTVYFMLTGQDPRPSHMKSQVYPTKGYSRELIKTVKKCLDQKIEARPQDIGAVRRMLKLDTPPNGDIRPKVLAFWSALVLGTAGVAYWLFFLPIPPPCSTPDCVPTSIPVPTQLVLTPVPSVTPQTGTPRPVIDPRQRVKEVLRQWHQEHECTFLRQALSEIGTVNLIGNVTNLDDRNALKAEISQLAGVTEVNVDGLRRVVPPFCEVLSAAQTLVNDETAISEKLTLQLNHPRNPDDGKITYMEGDLLAFSVMPDPAFGGYYYVVDMNHQNDVWHLFELRGSSKNEVHGDKPSQFGASDEKDQTHEPYPAAAPHGENLLLIIQSNAPILKEHLQGLESKGYQETGSDLIRALREAKSKLAENTKILVNYELMTSKAK